MSNNPAPWRPERREHIISRRPVIGKSRRQKLRILRKARGQATSMNSEVVKARINYLLSLGFTLAAIAAAAGVSDKTIGLIAKGEPSTTQLAVGWRIMQVTHKPVPEQRNSHVPKIGARRRVEALNAIGWSRTEIGARIGVSGDQISAYLNKSPRIQYATWAAIREVYEQLSGTPGPSEQSIKLSRTRGYAPPIAWEGLDIDHPDQQPEMGSETTTSDVDEVLLLRILRGDYDGEIPTPERKAVIDYAIEHGWTKQRVADVLNLKPATADQALIRRRRELRKTEETAA